VTRAVVFANGDCSVTTCSLINISKDDFLVCADGGTRHCLAAGLQPDLIIGDLDSVGSEISSAIADGKIECLRFPPEKNASDLELTLEALCDRPIQEVVLLGISGGRTDHLLFNWQLAGSRSWPFGLRLVDDYVDAHLVDKSRALKIPVPTGQTFSVIPLTQTASGVGGSGALYPLRDATLSPGSTLGLSNEATDSRLQVSVEQGIVLVLLVHSER